MKKRFLGAIAALATAALAVGAVPAFTADSGTISVSITAQAPVAPCLTVTPGTVNFGTLPFSTNNGAGLSEGNTDITVNFCGTASGQNLLGSTTNATGSSGSWTPTSYFPTQTIEPCPASDRFYLSIFGFTNPALYMTGSPAPVLASSGGAPAVFPLGDKVFRFGIVMPCTGSNGPGETKQITSTFTAVIP